MTVNEIHSSDWSADRGDAWRDYMVPLEAMLEPINAPLDKALRLTTPFDIADIGCGGGETSVYIAENAAPGSHVTGFDISPALIEAANRKLFAGKNPVRFLNADAQLPLHGRGPFDRLVSRFGVMFFAQPELAFRNLYGWLKPGGRFAFAVWGPPAQNPWMSTVRTVLQRHIDLPDPEPDAPGPFRYQNVDQFKKLLHRSGFRDVENESWQEQLALGGGLNAIDAVEFALSAFSIGQYLTTCDHKTTQAARADLVSVFSEFEKDDVVCMDSHVHIVTGDTG